MRPQILGISSLIIRETLCRQHMARRPEPMPTMEDSHSVEAFHAQGSADGPLLPLYHFNALATSRLMPAGGTLVDLGSGSGQYLAYLAQCRPDIRIIGLDLSETMIETGNRCLETAGLKERVDLKAGDMTDFSRCIPESISLISSVFALHHLPGEEDLVRCLEEIARVIDRCGCGVWLFDHARPRHPGTADRFPEVFTPEAPCEFRNDSRNSLMASFSFSELSRFLDGTVTPGFHHVCSRFMRLYQAHWLKGNGQREDAHENRWVSARLSPSADRQFKQFRSLMHGVPTGV